MSFKSAGAMGVQPPTKPPVATGCLDYFPDALREVALVSATATTQHFPGEEMRWDRATSPDESNALIRHFLKRGTRDDDGMRHSAKVAWRALALLQKEVEADAKRKAAQRGGTPDDRYMA